MVMLKTSLVMTAGTAFLLWIGDQITTKGIGNGQSLLIMAGILQSMPSVFKSAFTSFVTAGTYANWLGILLFVLFVVLYILIIVGVVWITLSERRIPIQYANHTTSTHSKNSSYLPIKINSAGVMPVIFASIVLTIPVTIAGLIGKEGAINFINKYIVYTTPTGFILYIVLIMLFGYFWTFLQMNPEELSKDLNKRGGYIPGIRPGKDTTEYVSKSLSKLTLVGSIFLVVLAGIPIIFSKVSGLSSSVTIGGTGILIVVGVAIETYKQIESGLVSRNYGRMRKNK
jgi:preprotein translocase subunit SecY